MTTARLKPPVYQDLPLLVRVDDPSLTHDEALTRTAAYVVRMGDDLRDGICRLLRAEYQYARTACGQIYPSTVLLHRIAELMGEA